MLPKARLDLGGAPLHFAPVPASFAAKCAHLRQLLIDYAGEARAPATLQAYRHPALKFLRWMATRQRPLPPSCEDAAEYSVFIADLVDTVGSVSTARSALSYLCVVNGWDKDSILSGRAVIPLDALRRRHRHEVRKTPGLAL